MFINPIDIGSAPLKGYLTTIEKMPTKDLSNKCRRWIRQSGFTRSSYFEEGNDEYDRLYYYVDMKYPERYKLDKAYATLYEKMLQILRERKIDKIL